MVGGGHHEELWRDVPAGLQPADFALRLSFLLSAVGAGQRVLDLGCGEGRFAAELASTGAAVLAADVAREPLRRAASAHPRLPLLVLPSEGEWPLPDASFDVVWAGEVIEHVTDTAGWLSQVRRVLRSGGLLLLSTPAHGRLARLRAASSERAFAELFDPLGDHLRFYTRRSLATLLDGFGFEQISVRSAAGPPWARRLLLARAVRARF